MQARAHPQATVIVHPDTEAIYAVLFLTEAELTGPRTVRPPLAAEPFPGEKYADRIEPYAKLGTVWLVARDDPNAGLAPTAWGYQEAPGRYDRFAQEHLGGTLMSPNDAGAGRLSAYYLELSALGGFDFAANDDLAFDLAAANPLGWTRSSTL